MAAVWLPELRHWYVKPAALTAPQVSSALAEPDEPRLREIGQMGLRGVPVPPDQAVARAQDVERGVLSLPGFPPAPIRLPFDADDLERGSPTWRLMFASLASADLLIDGYLATGRQAWLDLAERVIVDFARHESSRWLDQGLMWNDHATSARVAVLVKFWALHRARAAPSEATTQAVLRLVSRSALLLMRADAYAWRTSHGILADLGLLQIAAAFPTLPQAPEARRIAWQRLQGHLKYWVNAEGMTLLHSAGYHSGSLYHLSMTLRLMTLNGLAIPDDWWSRFERALDVEALLRRPDGTLPLIGDTANISESQAPLVTARGAAGQAEPLRPLASREVADAMASLPAAGLAIWRDTPDGGQPAQGSQTALTWSYYPGLGHKLADELSVVLWSRGQTWITNTGYWPYGMWGREDAESWTTSNAPHLVGEPRTSRRESRILSTGQATGVRYVEVQRQGPDGFKARRQLLRLVHADAWLVIDHETDPQARPVMTAWTLAPELAIGAPDAGGRYTVQAPQGRGSMALTLADSQGSGAVRHQGERSPLLGWVVVERTPQPAPTLVVQRPASGGWSLASLAWAAETATAGKLGAATMRDWQGPERWTTVMDTAHGPVVVQRDGPSLSVSGAQPVQLRLAAAEPGDAQRAEALQAFDAAARTFRKFPEVVTYRERVSLLLMAVFLIQSSVLMIWQRWLKRSARWAHGPVWATWLGGGTWLHLVYFGF